MEFINSVEQIISELRFQLKLNNSHYLRYTKNTNDDIMVSCPFHKNGMERKPSMGIKIRGNSKVSEGTCHCFTCGTTCDLAELVSKCFDKDDFGVYGQQWLIKHFIAIAPEDRVCQFEVSRGQKPKEVKFITEEELDQYRYTHPYILKRKITEEVIDIFDIGYDANFELGGVIIPSITFPVRDVNGNTLFVARRAIKQKLYHYPEDVEKPIYGLFELKNINTNTLIICESMINALTCWSYGQYAVALNGLGSKEQIDILKKLPYRKYIVAFDGDIAGKTATNKFKRLVNTKLVSDFNVPLGKDINDLSREEFYNFLEKCIQ